MVTAAAYPTLRHERRYWSDGAEIVVGLDEVGRGSWAGPVTVGAVIPAPDHLKGIRDSKQLDPPERERAAARVHAWARAVGVGHASPAECDECGMTEALRRAASRALAQIEAQGFSPDRILLDGNHDYLRDATRVRTIIKGDTSVLSISAASVIAKVTRDAMMRDEAAHYPAYDFESNKGYPSPTHKAALNWWGPSTIHRRSWIFMDSLCWGGVPPAPGRLF